MVAATEFINPWPAREHEGIPSDGFTNEGHLPEPTSTAARSSLVGGSGGRYEGHGRGEVRRRKESAGVEKAETSADRGRSDGAGPRFTLSADSRYFGMQLRHSTRM